MGLDFRPVNIAVVVGLGTYVFLLVFLGKLMSGTMSAGWERGTFSSSSPSIIVCIPETCKKILTDERFAPGYPISVRKLTGSKSFHSVSNSEHRRLRKLTTAPINGHEALAMYIGYIENIVITDLEEWTSMNRPIEFLKEMERVTFKVLTHIFMGSGAESIRESTEKYHNDFHHGLLSAAYNIPAFPFHKALKARNMFVKIFHDVLDERRSKSDHPYETRGMIDLLMKIEDENGEKVQ
ncbi:Ent-kaurenoic acid oxidase, putative [Theobroma cacao]|uniref:Ent-kaurenoic acid oxidase, putative n=1 Tax=Theobroma cacao TaxID=3641 RepID=A0A061G2G1_THECC|nr:Ent-kaurenoic acid oxidase, putative [Theobroma cacao]